MLGGVTLEDMAGILTPLGGRWYKGASILTSLRGVSMEGCKCTHR